MAGESRSYAVLVVEDNPDIVVGLHDLLTHDGYAVHTADSCASALAHLRSSHFNAVLLDVTLPDGDGLDLLNTIQQLDPQLPVIIVTASTATDKTVGSLTRGAFAYLTKPYHREELRQTLRRAIGVKELAVKAQRAEHLLTESEDRFRSLVESATDAIVVADGRGTILSHNHSAARLFGYHNHDLIGQPLTRLMPARYHARHNAGLARMEAGGASRLIGSLVELQGLRQDGTEFPIELSLATWKTATGHFYSGIIRDVSRRRETERALDALRRRHSLILTQAGEGIYGIDRQGLATFVNPRAAAMVGYSVEDLIGRPMHALLHHTRMDGTPYPDESCPIYAALHDGEIHRVTHEVFWKRDGTSFPVEYVSSPLWEDDTVTGAVVVFHDTTKRWRIESGLRKREDRLAYVIRGSSDGFWDGQILPDQPWHHPDTPVWWSARVREMLGYSEEEFPDILESWTSRLHPDDRERVLTALAAHLERRDPYDVEYRLLAKHGEYHWFRARGLAVWDEQGRPTRMAGSLQSITDRKQMEEALRRSERLLKDVIDNTTAVIYVKQADGRFLLTNRRFQQLFNLPADRIVGRTNHDIFPPEIAEAFSANDRQVLERNAPIEYDEVAPHQDGLHDYLSIKFPLCDETGRPYAVCGISTDITERKRIGNYLRASEERIQLALMSARIGIWDWDLLTDRCYWSPTVYQLLGRPIGTTLVTREEFLSMVHQDDRAATLATLRAAGQSSQTDLTLTHRLCGTGGALQWLTWSGQVFRDATGAAVRILGTVQPRPPAHDAMASPSPTGRDTREGERPDASAAQ
ncbi:PAS domain S-box protein [Nitrospira sp. NS4]|uniref:PAS domain-containing response regulator n=1 Tax=Nitrospira sp. NS4 TaxID=3414498 RepID=UPI003C2E6F44